jgi:DNA-binding Lrp family transcriptional regulator
MENHTVEDDMDRYYDKKIVTAIVGLRVDISQVESIATLVLHENNVEDVFVVTGEFDILVKVRFPTYGEFQKYLLSKLSKIPGVKDSKTMMVIGIKKENRRIFVE